MVENENICEYCKKSFCVRKADLKRGYGKFCNKTCFYASRKNIELVESIKVVCKNPDCNYEFYLKPGEYSKRLKNSSSKLLFCSRKCKDYAQRLFVDSDLNPKNYGNGEYNYRKAYLRYLKENNLPIECNICNYQKYVEILEVHHKDTNRQNNTKENFILLCPNCHAEHHYLTHSGKWKK